MSNLSISCTPLAINKKADFAGVGLLGKTAGYPHFTKLADACAKDATAPQNPYRSKEQGNSLRTDLTNGYITTSTYHNVGGRQIHQVTLWEDTNGDGKGDRMKANNFWERKEDLNNPGGFFGQKLTDGELLALGL